MSEIKDRIGLEEKMFLDNFGTKITLEIGDTLLVPRISILKYKQLGMLLSRVLAKLFPDSKFFMSLLEKGNFEKNVRIIHSVLFGDLFDEVMDFIVIVFEVEESKEEFLKRLTLADFALIINTIIEQEAQNEYLKMLVKKTVEVMNTVQESDILSTLSVQGTDGQ